MALARLDLDVDQILEHMSVVWDERESAGDRLGSIHYFTTPQGITKLRELEAEKRRRPVGERRGGAVPLTDLLDAYSGVTA